jgi:sulfite reductase (ferredoxin)
MMIIPQTVIQEHLQFRQKVQDFKDGVLAEAQFRPYRASFGIYEQRQDGTFMVRPRIPSGVITLDQFRAISTIARKLCLRHLHLTTRQDLQFHGVELDQIADVIEQLLPLGLITKGTGGNTARNIAISPLTGVSEDDVFDVTAYALAAADHLLQDPAAYILPRKYKIAFANSPADTANATLSDLGFIARIENGQPGFAVYGGGGLGGSPNPAILLQPFIPANQVLYFVAGMKELFARHGDRENRNKARIRFILKRLGDDAFKQLLADIVQEIRQNQNLDLPAGLANVAGKLANNGNETNEIHIMSADYLAKHDRPALPADQRLVRQKQPGLFAVYVHPLNGNISLDQLDAVLAWIGQLPQPASIRLTNTQGFYVRDLRIEQAAELLQIISDFTEPTALSQSIACTGAATCRLGLCRSQDLLAAIHDRFKNESAEIKAQLPRLYISGCHNSCGQHQVGLIGLHREPWRHRQSGPDPLQPACRRHSRPENPGLPASPGLSETAIAEPGLCRFPASEG